MRKLYATVVAVLLSTSLSAAPAPASFGFPVKLVFTPKATRYLVQHPQKYQITAVYSGEPIPSKQNKADREEGTITIGNSPTLTIAARSTVVPLPGGRINRQTLPWVKSIIVDVEAQSEIWDNRWAFECSGWHGGLAAAQRGAATVTCDLAPVNFLEQQRRAEKQRR